MSKTIRITDEMVKLLAQLVRPGQTYDGVLRDLAKKARYSLKKHWISLQMQNENPRYKWLNTTREICKSVSKFVKKTGNLARQSTKKKRKESRSRRNNMNTRYINHWLIVIAAWMIGVISYLVSNQPISSSICLFGLCYSFRQWELSTSSLKYKEG